MTLEGLRLRIRNAYINLTASNRRKLIDNNNFTIISNNCWGGIIYESYGLEKSSPTVGMYFAPKEFIDFISNIEHYIKDEVIEFIPPEKARHIDLYKQDNTFGKYPIARLGNVEIAMLHYATEEEAKDKWERRCARICWDHLIVKMNDQNGCTYEDMVKFLNTDIKCSKKLFFTVHKEWQRENSPVVYIPQFYKGHVYASMEPFGNARLCNININEIINKL